MTQCEMVEKYIRDYGSITTLEAFTDLGIVRLGSRIYDLRKRGLNIASRREQSVNRFGKIVTYKRYWIEEDKEDV